VLKLNKVFKDSATYLSSTILVQALPFLALAWLTRVLKTEEFGLLALANAFGSLSSSLAHIGMSAVFDRNYFEYQKKNKEIALLFSILIFTCFSSVLLLFLISYFEVAISVMVFRTSDLVGYLALGHTAATLETMRGYLQAFLRNRSQAARFSFLTITNGILTYAIAAVLILLFLFGAKGLLWGQIISDAATLFVFLSILFVRSKLTFDKEALYHSIRLAIPLTPRIFIGIFTTQMDKYLMGLLGSLGEVGIYSVAQRFGTITFTLMTALGNVYSPRIFKYMFEETKEEGGRKIGLFLTPFAYLTAGFGIAIALFSEEMLKIFSSVEYHHSFLIVSILCCYYSLSFFGTHNQLVFAKRMFEISALTIVQFALNAFFCLVLIPKWGAMGAASGMLVAHTIKTIVFQWRYEKVYRIRWETKKLLIIYCFFFIILFGLWALSSGPYEYRLILKFAASIFYFYLGNRFEIFQSFAKVPAFAKVRN